MTGFSETAGHLAAIISSSDDAIISKDLNGIVQTWNGAAEQLFGYTAAEAIGRHISMIIPSDRLDEEEFVIGQVRAGVGVSHYETIRQRKDGSLVEISLTVSPIHAADGSIVGASKIARDISVQNQLRRKVEEASRAKDEFLATLSHELRTPLNTVVGYIHMLQRGAIEGDQQARALEVISRNATALARLVDDVLDTSRIITGKMHVELRPVDLAPIVEQAVASMRPTAGNREVDIRLELSDHLRINGDPDRLGQVIRNLLSNAVKFTPPGGSVTVRARREGRLVRVEVQDTGIGITAEQIPLLFRRFWQGHDGAPGSQPGLGLGLALARHFVEGHGGAIAATSDGPGRGSTFSVELPAIR